MKEPCEFCGCTKSTHYSYRKKDGKSSCKWCTKDNPLAEKICKEYK